ncbi:head decoration protein [Maridesulfovibrio ferrireducens]|uniref:head decoration protein n=1 Tax=Maridesulfovibrio ferrireducens TaxID=246191 RepID=UPI001A34CD53|nr:head decoration protein [Maridesulfovibrio ferrireducens]MBI9112258.1 head decoration protein [Maridesulfovibrio ferrireducens]
MYKQKKAIHDIVIRENDRDFGRENVTIGQSKKHPVGTVMGRKLFSVPEAATPGAGNVGLGNMSDISINMLAMYGPYTMTCVEAEAAGGRFIVTTPEGVRLPDALVGTPFVSPHINFTISDSDPDFVVGDSFTVEIGPGDGKAFQLDPAATDGTQIPYGFTADEYDATNNDFPGVVIKERALIRASNLVWPEGFTPDQIENALTIFASRSILNKEGV